MKVEDMLSHRGIKEVYAILEEARAFAEVRIHFTWLEIQYSGIPASRFSKHR